MPSSEKENTNLDEKNIKLRLLEIAQQYAGNEIAMFKIYNNLVALFDFPQHKNPAATGF